MRIKLYIVTYDNQGDLHNNLLSLKKSNFYQFNPEIFIINNHSNFHLDNQFKKIKVLHNNLRPDFSTGHLSRNWNQAIINGFQNLNEPNAEIVITAQDDTIFLSDWIENLLSLHETYSFIQNGIGDNLCSYTVEAIKNIGLWDERLCNIGYQEADYFLRSLIYNKDKTCLNDHQHGRLINPSDKQLCIRPKPANEFSEHHHKTFPYHSISQKVFEEKWGNAPANYWTKEVVNHPPTISLCKNYIYYPYFEKDIYELHSKNYII